MSFLEGGNPQELLPEDERTEDDPSWSADGNSLVFAHYGGGSTADFAILQVDVNTHQVSTVPNSVGMFAPRRWPDGHILAGLTADQHKLMLFQPSSGQWSELASGRVLDYPCWSRDGKYIYYEDQTEDGQKIFRVRVADRKTEFVVSLKDIPRVAGYFGHLWFGLGSDDSPPSSCVTLATGRFTLWNCSSRSLYAGGSRSGQVGKSETEPKIFLFHPT
jgi:hypothetical protein